MLFREISSKDQWIFMKSIHTAELPRKEYRCYMVFEQKMLSLYAVVSNYGKKLYDAQLKDFALNVFSLVVENVVNGQVINTMELLTGTSKNTVDSAIRIIEKNFLDTTDDFTRIEVVLEKSGIPYVKDLDQIAKSYVRGRIRIIKPELQRHFANKNFAIDLTAGDALLSQMFSAATKMQLLYNAKRSPKDMTATSRAEAAVTKHDSI